MRSVYNTTLRIANLPILAEYRDALKRKRMAELLPMVFVGSHTVKQAGSTSFCALLRPALRDGRGLSGHREGIACGTTKQAAEKPFVVSS
jgi:hypothetical protein